jgi:hypothetical protein
VGQGERGIGGWKEGQWGDNLLQYGESSPYFVIKSAKWNNNPKIYMLK